MFVSTRYTLSHRATQVLSVATATTCTDRDIASVHQPIADPTSAWALGSWISRALLRNPQPCAEHPGGDRGSSLPGFSWLQNTAERLQSQCAAAKSSEKASSSYR